ncbi:MAG: hypothetical protein ACYDC6_11935 [Acidobacteriaceae bacterium]
MADDPNELRLASVYILSGKNEGKDVGNPRLAAGEVVAIDGKTLRGMAEKTRSQCSPIVALLESGL